MKALAGFKNEIWYMNVAYVDKLANDNNGIKYLLGHPNLFHRTVDAEGRKTKDSKNGLSIFDCDYKKQSTHKELGRQGNISYCSV